MTKGHYTVITRVKEIFLIVLYSEWNNRIVNRRRIMTCRKRIKRKTLHQRMNYQENMMNFYKVIYSERSMNPIAAKIVAEETNRMILATKQLFYAMEVHKMLHFTNPDMSAVSFAMTIHGLMDYELDQRSCECWDESDKNLLDDYLKWFCEEKSI